MKNTGEKPDLFELLQVEEDRIAKLLKVLTEVDSDLSTENGLKKSKDLFDLIRKYLNQQDKLVALVEQKTEAGATIQAYKSQRDRIYDLMSQLTLMHVDETDYFEKLRVLLNKVKEMADLEDARLHKKLRRYLNQSDIEHMRENLLKEFVSSKY